MAGSLYHAKTFRECPYVGRDGRHHHEIQVVDGDIDIVSISTWNSIETYCSSRGIPTSAWPRYVDGIDISLRDVEERNRQIRDDLLAISPEEATAFPWLQRLIRYVGDGELVFFADE